MKQIIFIILIILLTFSLLEAQNYWQRTNGPFKGTFNIFEIDNHGNIYGGLNALYISIDNGYSWKPFGVSFDENPVIKAIAFNDSNHIFVGTIEGLYRSKNNGITWDFLINGLKIPISVYSISIRTNNDIYIGTLFTGVYKSSDNGETWELSNNGFFNESRNYITINCIATLPNGELIIGTNENGIYIYDSSINYWYNTGLYNLNVVTLNIDYNGYIYAGTYLNGVFISKDQGQTWIQTNNGLTSVKITSIKSNEFGDIYAGTNYGIFKSTNSGNSWVKISHRIPHDEINSLIINSEGYIFAATKSAIYRTTDFGLNWINVSKGLGFSVVNSIVINNSNDIYISTWKDGIYKSDNLGITWELINDGINQYSSIRSIAINEEGDLFIATSKGIYYSTNCGQRWELAELPTSEINFYDIVIDKSGQIFAGSLNSGIYKSVNNGKSWSLQNGSVPWDGLYFLSVDSKNNLYSGANLNYTAVFADCALLRSIDEGKTWEKLFYVGPISYAFILFGDFIVTSNNSMFLAGCPPYTSEILRSIDDGKTWEDIDVSPSAYITTFALNSEDHLFAASMFKGVYCSKDYGNNWIVLNSGIENLEIISLVFDKDEYLYAGTDNGLFRSNYNDVTSININQKEPQYSSALYQNYPNPFNSITKFKFFLYSPDFVQLSIYNIQGRKIESLFSGYKDQGNHTILWNAENYSSGIYLYQLTGKNFSYVKKLILIK